LARLALCRNRLKGESGAEMENPEKRKAFRAIHLLLLIPFIATLWVPFYNRALPALDGVPFFYWYQIVWVALTALILWIVYLLERAR
jgi:hypothetical protein